MLDGPVLRKIETLLSSEGRLIRLPTDRTIVFVGDTHGDIDATEKVFDRYLSGDTTIVFLGDAVDRGPDSAGNLRMILETKLEHPDSVYLLMGNHEGYGFLPFSPADFWEGLPADERDELSRLLLRLPLAAWHPAGIIGLHGALPEADEIEEIERIKPGSNGWMEITWGDWTEYEAGGEMGAIRPTYDRYDFERRASRLGIKVLVRSHQPNAPLYMFDDRCLTIFTSSAYGRGDRSVAVLHPDRRIETARDLEIIGI